MKYYRPFIHVIIYGIVISLFSFNHVLAANKEIPSFFAHTSSILSSDQIVNDFMVAGGEGTIFGQVRKCVIVIDGNLAIKNGAIVDGQIIILGGDVQIEDGAIVERIPWIIAPQGHPLVPFLVAILLGLGAFILIVLPLFLWFIYLLLRKTSWYSNIERQLFYVEKRWPFIYVTIGLLISGLMLALFSEIAWNTLFRHTLVLFDDSFIWLIRYFSNPYMDKVMIGLSDLGFGTSYIVLVGLALLVLIYSKRWKELMSMAICLAGGAVLSSLLKNLFHRARPEAFWVVPEIGYSFPSGHALATLCFYGMVAFLLMRSSTNWHKKIVVVVLTMAMVVVVGISRVYLGVHYPTDVIAGYAIGSMWLAFCISFLLWWEGTER